MGRTRSCSTAYFLQTSLPNTHRDKHSQPHQTTDRRLTTHHSSSPPTALTTYTANRRAKLQLISFFCLSMSHLTCNCCLRSVLQVYYVHRLDKLKFMKQSHLDQNHAFLFNTSSLHPPSYTGQAITTTRILFLKLNNSHSQSKTPASTCQVIIKCPSLMPRAFSRRRYVHTPLSRFSPLPPSLVFFFSPTSCPQRTTLPQPIIPSLTTQRPCRLNPATTCPPQVSQAVPNPLVIAMPTPALRVGWEV